MTSFWRYNDVIITSYVQWDAGRVLMESNHHDPRSNLCSTAAVCMKNTHILPETAHTSVVLYTLAYLPCWCWGTYANNVKFKLMRARKVGKLNSRHIPDVARKGVWTQWDLKKYVDARGRCILFRRVLLDKNIELLFKFAEINFVESKMNHIEWDNGSTIQDCFTVFLHSQKPCCARQCQWTWPMEGPWFTSVANPIVKIRRSYDRLVSTMGFSEVARRHLCMESALMQYCVSVLGVIA